MNSAAYNPPTVRHALLSWGLKRLSRKREKMFAEFEGWNPDWLSYKPSEHGWSVLQVLDHLARSEGAVRILGEQQTERADSRIHLVERLRLLRFKLLLRLPVKISVPRSLAIVSPETPESLEAVTAFWRNEHALLEEFVAIACPASLGTSVLRHPAVGRVSLSGVSGFLLAHLAHHQYQLWRVRFIVSEVFL
ncbi:hypothetical protein ACPOL_4606 [Acidisarcina polymorpha]|uniref:DinB-like domain-containing protein n=1 Tax=Acidisarcina polymorpha TaxID=2211140 RepID=A0A2Z5G447_9BACT|nr:DinB family protein [Acidisarcina polymorpha]AXC13878.1 hypothetical protein ACPOL_4606 [Acidisarcina polymorpha]